MTTTAVRVSRSLGSAHRRFAILYAAVTSTSVGPVAEADAAETVPGDPGPRAGAALRANLNEAGFFLRAAQLLTEEGNEAAAALATAEAEHFLGLAEGAAASSLATC